MHGATWPILIITFPNPTLEYASLRIALVLQRPQYHADHSYPDLSRGIDLPVVEATIDIVQFRVILKELSFEQLQPTPLFVDNKSLITLAQQFSSDHKWCKHFLARIHYTIEQASNETETNYSAFPRPMNLKNKTSPHSSHLSCTNVIISSSSMQEIHMHSSIQEHKMHSSIQEHKMHSSI